MSGHQGKKREDMYLKGTSAPGAFEGRLHGRVADIRVRHCGSFPFSEVESVFVFRGRCKPRPCYRFNCAFDAHR